MDKDTLKGFEFDPDNVEKASDKFDELLSEYIGSDFEDVDKAEPRNVKHPRGLYEKIELEHDFLLARIKVLEDLYMKLKEAGKDLQAQFYIMQAKRIIEPIAAKGDIYEQEDKEPLIDPDRLKERHREILNSLKDTLGSDIAIQIEALTDVIVRLEPKAALLLLETVNNQLKLLLEQASNEIKELEEQDYEREIQIMLGEEELSEEAEADEDIEEQEMLTTEEEEEEEAETEDVEDIEEYDEQTEEQIEEEQANEQEEEKTEQAENEQEEEGEMQSKQQEEQENKEEKLENIAKQSPLDNIVNAIEEELDEEDIKVSENPEEDEFLQAVMDTEESEETAKESVWDAHPLLKEIGDKESDEQQENENNARQENDSMNLENDLSSRIISEEAKTSAKTEQETANHLLKDDILFIQTTEDFIKAAETISDSVFVSAEDTPIVEVKVGFTDDKSKVVFEFAGTRLILEKQRDAYVVAEHIDNIEVETTHVIERAYISEDADAEEAVFVTDDNQYIKVAYLKRSRFDVEIETEIAGDEYPIATEAFVGLAKVFSKLDIPELEAFNRPDILNETLTEPEKDLLSDIE